MTTATTTGAYCHELDCDWTAGPSTPLGASPDEVDTRARRHTGDRDLKGPSPHHPTTTTTWPTRGPDADRDHLHARRDAHRQHVLARRTLIGWTPPGSPPPSSAPTPAAP